MGIWLLVGFRHLTEFFFEVSDLVAQTGRKLELELFGGGVHLFAQLANQVGEIRDLKKELRQMTEAKSNQIPIPEAGSQGMRCRP